MTEVRSTPANPTLRDEMRFFTRQRSPQLMAILLTGVFILRIVRGSFGWLDLAVVVGFILLEPFVEWVIHVFILHWKPKEVFGRRLDPLVARKHREHHQDPRNSEWVFVPLPVLAKAIPASALLYLLVMPTFELALTAMTTALTILFSYEWTHHLIHSRYQPRSWAYKRIWRAHRLHHYKNENYWFGVTSHAGDRVLGTFPAKDAVPTSPTCRDLGRSGSLT